MHGDPQHGGSVSIISIGDTQLTSVDHEALEAHQPSEGETDAKGQRIRIDENERGRDSDPAGSGNAGDDTGRGWGHQGDLFGPADSDGREGLNGTGGHAEHAEVQQLGDGVQPARDQVSVFHVPAEALPKALQLGAALGVEKVIQATDEHTVDTVQYRLIEGSLQFWSATQHGEFIGCLITEIVERATGTVLCIKYMSGKNPEDWLPVATEVMEPMALQAGCEAVTAETREGMRKLLISMGWRKVSINMRRELNGQQKQNR